MKSVCVFCSSRNPKNLAYKKATIELGKLIAEQGYSTIYGGSTEGLMAEFSKSVREHGGKILGILPEVFAHLKNPDEEVVKAKDFGERKAIMIEKSDAFICLPGGYGTIDEMSDVIVSKLLEIHDKPIVLINIGGFYDNLIAQFEKMIAEGFTDKYETLYAVVENPKQAIEYLKKYKPKTIKNSWIKG